MRFPMTLGLVFVLTACNNNTWGVDTEVDDTAADDTGVTDTSDTSSDTSDTSPTTGLCHPGDPIDLTGWTRTYNVTWEGATGTEVQSGLGADYTSSGQAAFVTKAELTTSDGDHLTTYDYRSCDNSGAGIWHESRVEGEATFDLLDFGGDFGDFADILALIAELLGGDTGAGGAGNTLPVNYRQLPTPTVPYLADQATLQAGGLVSYSYDLMTVGQTADLMTMPNCSSGASPDPDATCVGIEGNLQFLGTESVSVAAGTFDAYKVVDNRTEKWSEATAAGGIPDLGDLFPMPGGFFGNTEDQDLISVRYYAPGIGLVKEQTRYATADPNDWLIVRELTSHTVPTN